MTTQLEYLNDTYLVESRGTILEIGRNEKGLFAVLDKSIFYPQGGGQPSDKGFFITGDGQEIPVVFVGFQEGKVIHNLPDNAENAVDVNKIYGLKVSLADRLLHARLHSGGHLVSHVLEEMNPALIAIKGYHFPEGGYVEFLNESGVDAAQLLADANIKLRDAIDRDDAIIAKSESPAAIQSLRPHLAPFIPKDKPSRIVGIGDYKPLPCGGTHVKSLAELGGIHLTKVKRAKNNVRVRYNLSSG